MCGICGWVSTSGNVDRAVLDKMCDELVHRGPDDRGVFIDGNVGIAMRRLCIIGVSSGHQPIHNENNSNWIVFNGEIYNYLELKSELESKGHSFYTKSDTEVIIHLYEEFGEQAPEKLQGMFAFAIFDVEQQKLLIVRDRFGIKPLYFFWDEEIFIFSSEIQSILANPAVKREIDLQAMNQFFTFGYIPHTKTSFKNIYKLLPGCTLTLQNNKIFFNRYWRLTRNSSVSRRKSLSSYIDDFFEIFRTTIEKHLISEVPLGVFLSGGIDSSLVVGVMSRLSKQPVETFSIGYDHTGSEFDERAYAQKVSRLFSTTHTEFVIKPDIIEELPRIVQSYGEPIGNASVMLSYYLSREVAKHVTVALSGLGGDELCAGYERYMGATIADYYMKMPALVRKGIPRIIDLVPDSKTGSHFQERLKRFVRSASLPLKDRYYGFINKFNNIERRKLFTGELLEQLDENIEYDVYSQYWESAAQLDNLHKLMRIDIETYMVDDLLALTDKTSMAHSLEIRVPFLDHKLAEFLWNIPTNLKLHGLPNLSIKYFLKRASERILPKDVIYRRKKGFSLPLTIWLRTSLKTYIEDMLGESSLRQIGLFNTQYVRQLLDDHYARKANHDEKIFSLLSFVIWYRNYF